MEAAAAAAAALRSPTAAAAPSLRPVAPGASSLPFDRRRSFAFGSIKGLGRQQLATRRRSSVVRASSSPSPSESLPNSSPIAPLRMESPAGQFLSQILHTHPHLLPAAAEQQLEQLQTDREADRGKEAAADKAAPSGGDLVLYRRIAEVKEKEQRRTMEEILYALVVQKFVEADVSLIPALSRSIDSGRVDQWAETVEQKLERLHSREAYEMIENHLTLILGQRQADATVAAISKLRIGQVYAASVMYGYFLKRVDQRFQLEKSMKSLPWGSEEEGDALSQVMTTDSMPSAPSSSHPEIASWTAPNFSTGGPSEPVKPCRLRSYVMSFDSDTLQRYATIRSKEAFGIIEKHTEALFGKPEIVITPEGTVDSSKDEHIRISFAGLRRLIVEAVTFGSFLWDVESYVDSRYHFVAN